MRHMLACLVGLGIVLTGCNKSGGGPSKAVVQAAIESHLEQRGNVMLANMTLEVQDVKVTGDTAEAQVSFRSKQAPDLAVGVRYVLRRGDGSWKVESSSPTSGMGASPHGSMDSSPRGESGATPDHPIETPEPQSSH